MKPVREKADSSRLQGCMSHLTYSSLKVPLNIPSNNCAERPAAHVRARCSQVVKKPGQSLHEEEDFQGRVSSVKLGN